MRTTLQNFLHSSLLVVLGLSTHSVYAKLDFEDHAFPEFVTSARALAMGNAYISKVDDSWSAFYNPAGLGTVRRPQFHLGNISLEASSGLMSAVGDGPAIGIPTKFIDSFDSEKMREMLRTNQGELSHSRISLFPNFTSRYITMGYIFSQRNRAIINDDAENLFEIAERRDQGPVLALNASLFGGVLKVGVSGLYLFRRELNKSFEPTENVSISKDDRFFGKGLQVTAGTRLTLPIEYMPTFSLVIRNALSNDWEGISGAGAPDEIKKTYDLGFSITPQVASRSRLHLEANLKDVGNAYSTAASRRMALGAEWDFNRRIFVRAGYGDGWGSAGLGVRSRTFIFDLTTYAIDRSLDGFREQEDRRWVLSLASGF